MTEEDLEELIRRAPRRDLTLRPAAGGEEPLGQCDCGARITAADVYGERGDVDLGRPRRVRAARVVQYRCPLCGRTGELAPDVG